MSRVTVSMYPLPANGKGASEVGNIERDVEVTSPLLKVEKKESG